MRSLFKRWHKAPLAEVELAKDVLNSSHALLDEDIIFRSFGSVEKERMHRAGRSFLGLSRNLLASAPSASDFFEVKVLPGLYVFPSLLSPDVQVALLERLMHRDLSDPRHKTNLHLHYDISYPADNIVVSDGAKVMPRSFFHSRNSLLFEPKDPAIHRPLSMDLVLQRKLRWMTLGGQYDWTAKQYPDETPPPFPSDIAELLKGLFPDVDAQAAIVNFYTPGDTLSVHRDVSEECDRGLISISIGCDGIFIIGNEDGSQHVTMKLRSGDAVLMSDESRYAWHAVPTVLANTCPSWLESWPASSETEDYDHWRGWMKYKRINLNVRQMKNESP